MLVFVGSQKQWPQEKHQDQWEKEQPIIAEC